MKKILFLMLFISILSFSQIKFEKGYFITNSNNRVECLIKNADWKNTPTSFEYRIDDNGKTTINTIKDVKSFEIYNHVKYVRAKVKFDQSSNDLNSLSSIREPEFIEKRIVSKRINFGKY